MPPIVDVRGLSFSYPNGSKALENVSLRMERCETLALVGPNGAGKSTLLMHLNGLLPDPPLRRVDPERGVWIDQTPVIASNLTTVRRAVGLVFQDPDDQLFCPTVWEDVLFGPSQLGFPPEEAERLTRAAIETAGLSGLEDRGPHQLSVGQRKRACLAGVLATRPKLLALDEPTGHLDPRRRREFIDLLMSLATPKIIATHDLELVLEVATRIVVLDRGRVQAEGPPRAILSDGPLMERHDLEIPPSLRSPLSREAPASDAPADPIRSHLPKIH
jgi:energy-coupling factor transporter ATP-binding protein EcfA2